MNKWLDKFLKWVRGASGHETGPETGHHTSEQVAMAFAYAPQILKELTEAGLESPRLELYADASGVLILGAEVTPDQYELAKSLVRSERPSWREHDVAIQFCCGLVHAAEDAARSRTCYDT